eukprot:IDg10707t1
MLVEKPKWYNDDWRRMFSRNNFLKENVMYIVGKIDDSNSLNRASICYADAVFILSSPSYDMKNVTEDDKTKYENEYTLRDEQTVHIALTVRNVRTDIPIFCQTLSGDSNVPIRIAMETPRPS